MSYNHSYYIYDIKLECWCYICLLTHPKHWQYQRINSFISLHFFNQFVHTFFLLYFTGSIHKGGQYVRNKVCTSFCTPMYIWWTICKSFCELVYMWTVKIMCTCDSPNYAYMLTYQSRELLLSKKFNRL